MAKGRIQIYYQNTVGLAVPCAEVRYRLLDLRDNRVAASGVTDATGHTGWVDTLASEPVIALRVGVLATPSPLPRQNTQYRLEVMNVLTGEYEAPDLHVTQKHALLRFMAVAHTAEITERIRVRPYFQIRFEMKGGKAQPLANAPYMAYTTDTKGKKLVAKDIDNKPIKGNTSVKGLTPRIYCEEQVWFTFNLPDGSPISRDTRVLTPMVKGQSPALYELDVKNQVAVSSPGEGTKAQVSGKSSVPAVLNVEDEELLLLTPQVWKEFEELSGKIESTLAAQHQARFNLTKALESKSPEEISASEKALGLAEDKVKELLNKNFKQAADLKEVVVYESYDKGLHHRKGESSGRGGWRRRYIPAKKYEEMKAKRIKGIPIKIEFKAKAGVKGQPFEAKREAKLEKVKGTDIDLEKFKESFKKITTAAKVEKKLLEDKAWILDMGGEDFASIVRESDQVEVEKAAQWLRLVGGAGASAEGSWDPKSGKVKGQLQGNLAGKVVLYEGKYIWRMQLPSRNGWQMHVEGEDLGAILFEISCELYGFVGAKASLAGCVGVSIDASGKTQVKPEGRDRGDSYAKNFDKKSGLPRFEPAALSERPPKDVNGASLQVEAFAGVEGGIVPAGALLWLPPETKKPSELAKLSLDAAASAGAGANAQLHIYYASGRFRIKASARLCWGVGAKGAVDFVVDVAKMLELVMWIHSQLLNAGFIKLVYIQRDAFIALSQLVFAVVTEDSDLGRWLKPRVDSIELEYQRMLKRLENARARNQMVNNINKRPSWLIYATPETRGMLLHAITRHYPETHLRDAPKVEGLLDPQVHFLDQHKEAVLNILGPVHTRAEWSNVFQHMSESSVKLGDEDAGQREGDVCRFLDYGWSLNGDLGAVFAKMNSQPGWQPEKGRVGNSYLEKYLDKRSKLMKTFPKGYRVAGFDSKRFDMLCGLNGCMHEMFAQVEPAEALEEWAPHHLV